MKSLVALAAALSATTALASGPYSAGQDAGYRGHEVSDGQEKPDPEAIQMQALGEAVTMADLWVESFRRYRKIPAISIAVVRGDKTIWAKGFGHVDRARRQPATADTVYSICSISKLFTAVAFMQEWEKGTVRLDEPVTTYLSWANLSPDDRDSVPITMRGLLTHSAGLPREAVNAYWTGPDFPFPTRDEIRSGITGQQLLYPASRTFQYSNLGLTLVGETVEAVSGTPYGEYVTANILKPLELDNTQPYIPAGLYGKQMAVGWGSLKADGTRPSVKLFDAKGINPAAGFSSTVNDLARFAQWQFRLLKSEKSELLRASTLREMQRVHYLTPDRKTSWGLGFVNYQLDGRDIVGHGGSCPGYRSSLLLDPKNEMAIALAMNAMDQAGGTARKVGSIFGARGNAKQFDAPEGAEVDLSQYSGFYNTQPWGSEFFLVPWAGGLAGVDVDSNDPSDSIWRLKPLGNDRFRVMNDSGEERDIVTFHKKQNGTISHLERFGQRTYFLRPLK